MIPWGDEQEPAPEPTWVAVVAVLLSLALALWLTPRAWDIEAQYPMKTLSERLSATDR